jgi:hypothetical protein
VLEVPVVPRKPPTLQAETLASMVVTHHLSILKQAAVVLVILAQRLQLLVEQPEALISILPRQLDLLEHLETQLPETLLAI